MLYVDAHVHIWTPDTIHYPLAPNYRPENMTQLLGTMFDKDLAAKLGVAAISVWRRRKALGIPSCRRGNRSNLS